MTSPEFIAPGQGCEFCRVKQEQAETYRARMRAADKRIAALLGEVARLKDDLDFARADR